MRTIEPVPCRLYGVGASTATREPINARAGVVRNQEMRSLESSSFSPARYDNDPGVDHRCRIEGLFQSAHQLSFHRAAEAVRQDDLRAPEAMLGGKAAAQVRGQAGQSLGELLVFAAEIVCPLGRAEIVVDVAVRQMPEGIDANAGQHREAALLRRLDEFGDLARRNGNVVS